MKELFENIDWAIVAPFLIIQAILMVIALIDLIKADNVNGRKGMWVFIVVVLHTIGPIAYFIFGRRND
ncbi:PLD nuclease N-terminal domain-containing protein [Oceanobacillus sp. M65]|uniref:PLD nuclease N-terminal domain-containing protein n=1 Tax=Oceanobacillus jordanicus TaxID=2867266 RepID=A0AAW5BC32_9BACI|nr:PLD nuclease N-terminal domain-containing protein [Oceanobacillus jordanicus]MCG3421160.1 PLD nuclease N-terminal domain-containing protein [Oceanobacillus jordanicus]NAP00710.1 transcriptional regulator [Halomonas sp. MG34]